MGAGAIRFLTGNTRDFVHDAVCWWLGHTPGKMSGVQEQI